MTGLTPREHEVMRLVSQGHINKTAARALGISVLTVNSYLKQIFLKLGATGRAHAVALWLGQRGSSPVVDELLELWRSDPAPETAVKLVEHIDSTGELPRMWISEG